MIPILSPAGGTNVKDGCYAYTADLLALEKTSVSTQQVSPDLPTPVAGFLPLEEWATFLDRHPDKDFAAFVCQG